MSEQPDSDQKTEQPTAKRLADAVRNGDILQSRDFATALVMAAGAAWLVLAGPLFAARCLELLRNGLTIDPMTIAEFEPERNAIGLLAGIALPVASLFALCLLAAVAAPMLIGAGGFRGNAMAFKASRLNPATGLGRMFGTQGLIELGKALIKATLLGAAGYWIVTSDLPAITTLGANSVVAGASAIGRIMTMAIVVLAAGLAVVAAVDLPIQIFRRRARLLMTRHEVKEELRQTEGSPELKQAVRRKQHELLSHSARKALAEASVVLTNPTHFAVALRYVPGKDFAPLVLARGRGDTAQAIKALAREHGVPSLEYPQLARAIYFTSRAGQTIAEDLYIAVATILAFVFNLERAMQEGAPQPAIEVPPTKRFDEQGQPESA